MTVAMRVRRFLLLAFLAYVMLDLGCPLVQGAFSFDPADSVDAVSAYRIRPSAAARVAPVPSAAAFAQPRVPSAALAPETPAVLSLVSWRPHADRDQPLSADPRPTAEDD